MTDRSTGLNSTSAQPHLRSIDGFGMRPQVQRAQISPGRRQQLRTVRPRRPAMSIDIAKPVAASVQIIPPQPFAQPAAPKQQPTRVLQRQFTARPVTKPVRAQSLEPTRVKRHGHGQLMIVSMAVIVFFVGIFTSVLTLQTNHSAKAQVSALSNSSEDDAPPSEDKPSPSAVSNYAVAPQFPKYLKIDKLGVNARVTSVGLTKTGALGVPRNIYDTSWYNDSAKPGDPGSNGAVLIDGHVHGPTLPGVFVDLAKLAPGDTIQIVRGDNQTFTYIVKKVQNYDVNSLNTGILLTSFQPGQPGLNLVTCGGPYDKSAGEYTQRTVVFAVQS